MKAYITTLLIFSLSECSRYVKAELSMMAFCPAGYSPHGKHCFRKYGYGTQAQAVRKCAENKGSFVFEIHTLRQQREIENFLKGIRMKDAVWLDGYVAKLAHRETSYSFYWRSTFFPMLRNFKDPLGTHDYSKCVVIDPSINYQWARRSCYAVEAIVCATEYEKVRDY